jgi:hypothetical protein
LPLRRVLREIALTSLLRRTLREIVLVFLLRRKIALKYPLRVTVTTMRTVPVFLRRRVPTETVPVSLRRRKTVRNGH